MLRRILILSLMVSYYCAHSQTIGLAYSPGKIVKHSPKLYYNPPPFSDNIELNYTNQTDGSKKWHHQYAFPKWGYTATLIKSKDAIIGNIFTIMPHIQYRIYGNLNNQIFVRLGTGPALATKHWSKDIITDTINNYLGSTLNMYASIVLGGTYKITPSLNIATGVTLSHTSNTGIRKPNYGVNLFAGYLAAHYELSPTIILADTFTRPQKWKLGINNRLDWSSVEYGTGDGPFTPIYVGNMLATATFRQKHKMGLGVNMEYSGKAAMFIRYTNQDNILLGSYAINSLAYYEFIMGKFSIPLQVDIFLHKGFVHKGKTLAQRFGVMYYPIKKRGAGTGPYIGLILKSIGAAADHADISLGYAF